MNPQKAILRPADMCAYLSIGRTKLYDLNENDPRFPRKIRFSRRCVGWRKEEVDEWLKSMSEGV